MAKKRNKPTVEQKFPTAQARSKADEAIDKLDPTLPMTSYIDTWYEAYVAAGGKVVGVTT